MAFNKTIEDLSNALVEINEKYIKLIVEPEQPLDKQQVLELAAIYNIKPLFVFRPKSETTKKIVEDLKPQFV